MTTVQKYVAAVPEKQPETKDYKMVVNERELNTEADGLFNETDAEFMRKGMMLYNPAVKIPLTEVNRFTQFRANSKVLVGIERGTRMVFYKLLANDQLWKRLGAFYAIDCDINDECFAWISCDGNLHGVALTSPERVVTDTMFGEQAPLDFSRTLLPDAQGEFVKLAVFKKNVFAITKASAGQTARIIRILFMGGDYMIHTDTKFIDYPATDQPNPVAISFNPISKSLIVTTSNLRKFKYVYYENTTHFWRFIGDIKYRRQDYDRYH